MSSPYVSIKRLVDNSRCCDIVPVLADRSLDLAMPSPDRCVSVALTSSGIRPRSNDGGARCDLTASPFLNDLGSDLAAVV